MKKISLLLFTGLLVLPVWLVAQKKTVRGVVVDGNGTPVLRATVKVKGSSMAATTNSQGEFALEVSAGDLLEFSNVGYKSGEVAVGEQGFLVLRMQSLETTLSDVVLVGTRSTGRVRLETAVPVDVVNIGQAALPTGRMELTSILNFAVPSFNYNKQSGSDGADHIDLATLRGLGPDQTLVLVNGKRRHQTAFVSVFGTRGRGNAGTDLSAIPVAAIDRVEVLRDGASAQYGSDAIAGVINIITRKNVDRFTGNFGWSSYMDGAFNPATKPELDQYVYGNKLDGNSFAFNGNYGFHVGKNGFLNLTGNFLTQGKTYRQVLETDFNSNDYLPTNIYRRAHGDGSMTGGGGFANLELPLKGNTVFYAFGGMNYKASEAFAFTRNWSARPDRFPTNSNGDLDYVPSIMRVSADADTFYNPMIQTRITDGSLAAGVRGGAASHWTWDLSNTLGYNNFHFFGYRTFNASLGSAQTDFDDGGFHFLQNTVNANFNRKYVTIARGLNLALGAEYRYERYKLYAGEEASYRNYDATGNKATGAQGFPGYQPGDEVSANRSVVGAYADAEIDLTDQFLLSGALRAEQYSDFGFTLNYKLATRLKLGKRFNLRGSISSGFRAPSLQQMNFSSTFTTVQGGNIAEVRIVPNYLDITRKAGIPELKQEKSLNASLGFSWKASPELTFTVDGYLVNVSDRVVLTGQFDAGDPDLNPELAQELQDANIALAQFFANAVDTKNRGLDIVADYNKRWNQNRFRAIFTMNVQGMEISSINVPEELSGSEFLRNSFLSDREQAFILASAPNLKYALNLEFGLRQWTFGTRITHFGEVTLLGYGEDGLGIKPEVPLDNGSGYTPDEYIYGGKTPVDLYVGYQLNKALSLHAGADNLFNIHPDLGVAPGAKGWAYNNETGGPWDAVQMGGNGRRLFLRVGFIF
jgi:iron complex outermembrane receptor protein